MTACPAPDVLYVPSKLAKWHKKLCHAAAAGTAGQVEKLLVDHPASDLLFVSDTFLVPPLAVAVLHGNMPAGMIQQLLLLQQIGCSLQP